MVEARRSLSFLSIRTYTEELIGFRRAFQVEVMFADNALRIARLQGRLTHRPKFGDEHRNKGVAHDVV